MNNPLRYIDPTGHEPKDECSYYGTNCPTPTAEYYYKPITRTPTPTPFNPTPTPVSSATPTTSPTPTTPATTSPTPTASSTPTSSSTPTPATLNYPYTIGATNTPGASPNLTLGGAGDVVDEVWSPTSLLNVPSTRLTVIDSYQLTTAIKIGLSEMGMNSKVVNYLYGQIAEDAANIAITISKLPIPPVMPIFYLPPPSTWPNMPVRD